MTFKRIPGSPIGMPIPSFPDMAGEVAPVAILVRSGIVSWSYPYGSIKLAPNPIKKGLDSTLFLFTQSYGGLYPDKEILLMGSHDRFSQILRSAAPIGWDTFETKAGISNFARLGSKPAMMMLTGDPAFRYFSSDRVLFWHD